MGRTLRAKLIAFVVALAVLIAVALTVGSYVQMRRQMIDIGISGQITNAANDATRQIKSWIDVRTSIVSAGVDAVQRMDDPMPGIIQTAKSGQFQAAYIGMADKRMLGDHDMGLPPGYDPTSRPWYKENVNATGTVMTAPYIDMSTHKLVISFVAPVHKHGAFVGVFGTDVLLDDIVKNVLSINLHGDGSAMLIGKDGQVLVHKVADRVTKPASQISDALSPAGLASLAGSNQLREAEIDGVSKYLYAQEIPGANLYLVIVVDKSAALSPLKNLLWGAVATLVVLMLLILPMAGWQISRMLSGIRQIHDAMVEISQGDGDLTRKIEISGTDEIAETAHAFNRFQEALRQMFVEIQGESARLIAGVNQINEVVNRLSEDTQSLSSLTSENAAAIEQITVSISHIADHTSDADSLVKNTGALSSESAETVRAVADEVGRSAREVESLSSLLDRLSQRSEEIGGIIRVIRDIADQTNLLALNAAIEAARAGEQGRGFAVVADEVRKLAERTGQATVQITTMIEGIHREMGVAVTDMQSTLQTVQGGAASSEQTADKIATIRTNMDTVMSKMDEIALATHEQLAATTAMAQSAERITTQMQGSDDDLKQAAAAVGQLNQLASGLQQMFGRFKL